LNAALKSGACKEININDKLCKSIIDEIISNLMTFMFAGTDTTGNLSAMMIYFLSIRPDIQEKLRKEVLDTLNGRNVEDLQHSDLNKL
jgi:hypothetical protein